MGRKNSDDNEKQKNETDFKPQHRHGRSTNYTATNYSNGNWNTSIKRYIAFSLGFTFNKAVL